MSTEVSSNKQMIAADGLSVHFGSGLNVQPNMKSKSEELSDKVNGLLKKWKAKRDRDQEVTHKLKNRLENAVKKIGDCFEKRLHESYKDKEIEQRMETLGQILGEVQTIEDHFRQMEQKFHCVRSTVYMNK